MNMATFELLVGYPRNIVELKSYETVFHLFAMFFLHFDNGNINSKNM